jgi:hypothetical protein
VPHLNEKQFLIRLQYTVGCEVDSDVNKMLSDFKASLDR